MQLQLFVFACFGHMLAPHLFRQCGVVGGRGELESQGCDFPTHCV